jgi:hypothetical protein
MALHYAISMENTLRMCGCCPRLLVMLCAAVTPIHFIMECSGFKANKIYVYMLKSSYRRDLSGKMKRPAAAVKKKPAGASTWEKIGQKKNRKQLQPVICKKPSAASAGGHFVFTHKTL